MLSRETESSGLARQRGKTAENMGENAERRRAAPTASAVNWRAVVSHPQQSAPQKTLLRGPALGLSPLGRSLCMGCCTSETTAPRSPMPSAAQTLIEVRVLVHAHRATPVPTAIYTTIGFLHRQAMLPPAPARFAMGRIWQPEIPYAVPHGGVRRSPIGTCQLCRVGAAMVMLQCGIAFPSAAELHHAG